MPKSVFRFLQRQPEAVELENDRYFLRLPRYQDFNQWHRLRAESRKFLEPWEPTWRRDELTEGAYRARVVRGKQEYASGQAVPLFIFLKGDMHSSALRRAVTTVALANLGYFGVEFAVALSIGSVSLFADSVDFLEDASVNLLILMALGWSARSRARVGMQRCRRRRRTRASRLMC